MFILKMLATFLLVATILLSVYTMYKLYHYIFKNSLGVLGVIDPKKSLSDKETSKLFFLILMDIFIIIVGIAAPSFYLMDNLNVAFGFTFSVYICNIVSLVLFEYLSEKPDNLVKYALKHTDTPRAVLEFKIVAFIFAENEPSYLWDYKRKNGKTYGFNIEDGSTKYRAPEDVTYYFPLYKQLLNFKNHITKGTIERNSPLINKFILDNLTFLTTILTVLKTEKMVETLSNELGESELHDFNAEFIELNKELNKLCQFIKKEKVIAKTAEKNIDMLDTLSEIRSLKTFSKLIK